MAGLTNSPSILPSSTSSSTSRVTDRQFIESRRKVPYFSKARWEEVAPKLGLQTNLDAPGLELARYSPPACYLPASFHEELFQAGWRMMDVYKERVDQDREAAKV